MNQDLLEDCSLFLGLPPAEVEHLREHADLLPALLVRIGLTLLRQQPGNARPDCGDLFCRTVLSGWGTSAFTARQLIDWCQAGFTPQRQEAEAACRALCGLPEGGHDLTPHHLGAALRRTASTHRDGACQIAMAGTARGVKQWRVQESLPHFSRPR